MKPAKAAKAAKATDKEYEIESVVDSRVDANTRETQYLVKWMGYSAKDNTWEPEEHLAKCRKFIKKFEAQKQAEKKRPVKKRKVTKG